MFIENAYDFACVFVKGVFCNQNSRNCICSVCILCVWCVYGDKEIVNCLVDAKMNCDSMSLYDCPICSRQTCSILQDLLYREHKTKRKLKHYTNSNQANKYFPNTQTRTHTHTFQWECINMLRFDWKRCWICNMHLHCGNIDPQKTETKPNHYLYKRISSKIITIAQSVVRNWFSIHISPWNLAWNFAEIKNKKYTSIQMAINK